MDTGTLNILGQQLTENSEQPLLNFILKICDEMPVAFFIKDEQGKYLLVNKAFEAFVGMRKRDVIGKTDFDIMPADDARRCLDSDEQAKLQPNQCYTASELAKDKNGKIVSCITVDKKWVNTEQGDIVIGLFRNSAE